MKDIKKSHQSDPESRYRQINKISSSFFENKVSRIALSVIFYLFLSSHLWLVNVSQKLQDLGIIRTDSSMVHVRARIACNTRLRWGRNSLVEPRFGFNSLSH